MEMTKEKAAAIALALHEFLTGTVHDKESYILTFPTGASPWSGKALTLRKKPQK